MYRPALLSGFLILFSAFLICSSQTKTFQTNNINLTVTVNDDKRRLIGGLAQKDFIVSVDKKPVEVTAFTGTDQPANVGFIIDASGSVMTDSKRVWEKRKQLLAEGISEFLGMSNPGNEYFVASFTTKTEISLDWTRNRQEILQQVAAIAPYGHTALYDACDTGLQKVVRGRHSRHILIVISDGQDNASKLTFKNFRDALKDSDVLFYAIDLVTPISEGSSLGMEGQGILEELSALTGGTAFFMRENRESPELRSIFAFIAQEIKNQYRIGFTTNSPANDKKWHSVNVKVAAQTDSQGTTLRLTARTRKGFYN